MQNTLRRRGLAIATALAVASVLAACTSGASTGGDGDAVVLDPADLETTILTVSPTGVKPAAPEDVAVTDEQCEAAKAGGYRVGLAFHVTSNAVPQLQIKAITEQLEACGVEVIGVTDANFSTTQQTADLENMIQQKPDGIISVPTDGTAMGPAYKKVQQAGIKLVLSDIFVAGLEPKTDYVSLVGSDIASAGQIAGQAAAAYVPEGGTIGFVKFDIEFFATNARTQGAQDWVTANRPDIEQVIVGFTDPSKVEQPVGDFLTANPGVDALYTDWDVPAQQALSAMRAQGLNIPVTTVDLGTEVAVDMASGGATKAIGAQLPFEEGTAQAAVMIRALLGEDVPEYVVSPAVPVVPANLLEAWKQVNKEDAPQEVVDACDKSGLCG